MLDFNSRRQCSGCAHWNVSVPVTNPDGFVEAVCIEPADDRDRKFKRGSDCCSKWFNKLAPALMNNDQASPL